MKLSEITEWIDRELEVGKFDDVSNNSLQISRRGDAISRVAFGVDASADFIAKAAASGAELCVVHHGISWGGGIKRLTGGIYEVVKTAMDANIALYAVHLPLDANEKCGNNWEIARYLELEDLEILSLRRVAIGDIQLGDLPQGKWRHLSGSEVHYLKEKLRKPKR